ncbi:MAG TPA: xanthine dehydrogenase family protein molybdopterin-binding subunit [Solirubrobacteraceae bacterium]|nr:xanthine dehydrogenase family protein molybdopterin-binding subunit [Solirubrobacteraceae bacterium]
MALGARLLRVEDRPLLAGDGRFVDDVHVEGALEAAFVRSPVAHGRLVSAGVDGLLDLDGVEAVLTAADLGLGALEPPNVNPGVSPPAQPVLATGAVRFAGEPIAVIFARDRYVAEDARDAARPEIDELEPLVDPRRAIAADAPQIHEGHSNLVVDTAQEAGDVDAAFAAAGVVVERTFRTPRHSAMPIEGRGVVAVPDGRGLRIWSSSQVPHKLRLLIAELLALDPADVRVISPDVGGGFGVKAHVYPEEVVLAAAALRLGRPVKWVEDRVENLASAAHARKQEVTVRAAMSGDGELLALDVDMLCDQGAYGPYPHGVSLEALTTSGMLPGPYRLRDFRVRARTALTNTAPTGAYRGVGFVIATFVHERLMDVLAREVGLDPAEVRRRNLIRADEMPYTSATRQPYDNGDYARALETALERIGYADFAARRRAAAANGRRLGLGVACYVEPTGMNSRVFEMRGMIGIEGVDSAHVEMDGDGRLRVWTTTPSIGQGTTTTMAQLAAEALGVEPSAITIEHCDTGAAELKGTGTFASRSAASAGGAVTGACTTIRERLIEDAAGRLEAAEHDLEIVDGEVRVVGSPQTGVAIGELAAADPDRYRLSTTFDPPQTVYPYATHACMVSVDEETGAVAIERYVIAEDCGRIINPVIVEGQVHGATAQGVGGALYERHDYDEDGQLRTASLLDYLVPTAVEVPALELLHLELPTDVNATGVKGVGEGGTIGSAAAVANAVSDALGREFNAFPIGPEEIAARRGD